MLLFYFRVLRGCFERCILPFRHLIDSLHLFEFSFRIKVGPLLFSSFVDLMVPFYPTVLICRFVQPFHPVCSVLFVVSNSPVFKLYLQYSAYVSEGEFDPGRTRSACLLCAGLCWGSCSLSFIWLGASLYSHFTNYLLRLVGSMLSACVSSRWCLYVPKYNALFFRSVLPAVFSWKLATLRGLRYFLPFSAFPHGYVGSRCLLFLLWSRRRSSLELFQAELSLVFPSTHLSFVVTPF